MALLVTTVCLAGILALTVADSGASESGKVIFEKRGCGKAKAMAPAAAERRKYLLLTIYLLSQGKCDFNVNSLKLYHKKILWIIIKIVRLCPPI